MTRITGGWSRWSGCLRDGRGSELSPGFKRGVMDAIALLPPPEATAPARPLAGWRQLVTMLSTGEKIGAGAILGALSLLVIPGGGQWLAALDYSLSTSVVSLSIGDTVLSASLLSLAGAVIAGGLLAAGGLIGGRHILLGA